MASKIIKKIYIIKEQLLKINFNSKKYWEKRYKKWGNSWKWSYDICAEFKWDTLNGIIKEYNISSLIEFWCWDGNNLNLYNIEKYIGLDVSETAIKICIERYKSDNSKTFIYYQPNLFKSWWLQSDLTISFEVLFHLIEDEVYTKYLEDLFNTSSKYVLILSSNNNNNKNTARHYKNRLFIKNIPPTFELVKKVVTPEDIPLVSDFYLFKRR